MAPTTLSAAHLRDARRCGRAGHGIRHEPSVAGAEHPRPRRGIKDGPRRRLGAVEHDDEEPRLGDAPQGAVRLLRRRQRAPQAYGQQLPAPRLGARLERSHAVRAVAVVRAHDGHARPAEVLDEVRQSLALGARAGGSAVDR